MCGVVRGVGRGTGVWCEVRRRRRPSPRSPARKVVHGDMHGSRDWRLQATLVSASKPSPPGPAPSKETQTRRRLAQSRPCSKPTRFCHNPIRLPVHFRPCRESPHELCPPNSTRAHPCGSSLDPPVRVPPGLCPRARHLARDLGPALACAWSRAASSARLTAARPLRSVASSSRLT